MQRSYLEYAMSVIVVGIARCAMAQAGSTRILYAMQELGLTPDRPYRKCARVVGDVLGKYHPHGDQAVYDALVRLVQTFASRNPLLDGHGNFGSVDDDPPAAMRYTETRLAPIAHQALLEEIGDDTVDRTELRWPQQGRPFFPHNCPFSCSTAVPASPLAWPPASAAQSRGGRWADRPDSQTGSQ